MANRSAASSIDEYLAKLPPETRKVLEELRALIRAIAPGVSEKISYAMPTFELDGQYLVYLAGWQKHIGFYPITAGVAEAFGAELAPYRSGKDSLRFPLGQPMPTDLIRRIVELRVEEVTGHAARRSLGPLDEKTRLHD